MSCVIHDIKIIKEILQKVVKVGVKGYYLLWMGKVPLGWVHFTCDLNDLHLKI